MSDRARLGIQVNAEDTTEATLARVQARIKDVETAIGQLSSMGVRATGAMELLRAELGGLEAQAGSLESKLRTQVQLLKDLETAPANSVRAIRALRGELGEVVTALDFMTQRQVDALTRSKVYSQSIQDAIVGTAPKQLAGRARAEMESSLSNVFAGLEFRTGEQIARDAIAPIRASAQGTEESLNGVRRGMRGVGDGAAVATRESRHLIGAMDGLARGQYGAVMSSMGAAMRDAGLGATALTAGIAGFVAFMGLRLFDRMTQSAGEMAQKMLTGADVAGTSVERYSQLARTLELVSGNADTLDRAVEQLSNSLERAIADPSSQERGALATIFQGITTDQLRNMMRDPIDALDELRKRFQEMGPSMERTQLFTQVLHRGFIELAPVLRMTDEEFTKYSAAARNAGSMTDEQAKKLAEARAKSNELHEAFRGLGEEIATLTAKRSAVTDFFTAIVEGITKSIKAANEWKLQVPQEIWTPFGMMRAPGAGPAPAATAAIPTEISHGAGVSSARSWLAEHGYSPQAAAAIMGNIQVESGFQPSAGAGTAHQGLFQWDPTRWANAMSMAGGKFPSFTQQMEFMDQELSKIDPTFKTATGAVSELTTRFEQGFERSGGQLMGQRLSAAAQFAASAPTGPPGGVTRFDPKIEQEGLQASVKAIEEGTRLWVAGYDQQIAAARHNEQEVNKLEQQKAAFVAQQAEREATVREQYATRARQFGDNELADKMQQNNRLQTQTIEAQTQQVRAEQKGEDEAYRRFSEAQRAKIEDVKYAEQQILSSANTTAAEKIKAEQDAASKIAGIYDAWLGEIKGTYHQDEAEFIRVQREKVQAAREATKEIANAHKESVQEILRDSERQTRGFDVIRGAGMAAERAREVMGGRNGSAAFYQQDAALAQQSAQLQIEALTKVMNSSEATKAQQEEAAGKIVQVYSQMTDQMVQDFQKARQAWEKATEDIRQFFDSLGSAIKSGTNDILKAIITPQREIIHAGLTTIVETHRGQQIAQAVSNMLMKGIESAADSVEKAVMNMFVKAMGGTAEEGFGGLIMKLFGAGAPSAASFGLTGASLAPLTTAGTALTTAGAGLNAAAAALSASAATLSAGGAASAAGGAAGAVGSAASGAGFFSKMLSFLPFGFEQGGIVPSAQGGMVVGGLGGTLAMLHPQEMVLPRELSLGIQGMISGGRSGGAGAPVNVNYAPNIGGGPRGMSRAEFGSMLSAHASTLVGEIRTQMRSGWRP